MKQYTEKELIETIPHFKGNLSQVVTDKKLIVSYGIFKQFVNVCNTTNVTFKLKHMENYAAYIAVRE